MEGDELSPGLVAGEAGGSKAERRRCGTGQDDRAVGKGCALPARGSGGGSARALAGVAPLPRWEAGKLAFHFIRRLFVRLLSQPAVAAPWCSRVV